VPGLPDVGAGYGSPSGGDGGKVLPLIALLAASVVFVGARWLRRRPA
jgi:hypothetical protein